MSHPLVNGDVRQLDGSLLYVVHEEVPLHTDMFNLLAYLGILGVRDGTLVVFPYGGGFGEGGGGLKISPISWRTWRPALVASAEE
jgi:hypothetical protein